MKTVLKISALLLAFLALLVVSDLETTRPQAQTPDEYAYVLPLVSTSDGFDTGIAITDGGTGTTAFLEFVNMTGIHTFATVGIGQPVREGIVKTVNHVFREGETWIFNSSQEVARFKGSVRIRSDGPLAGVAIVYGTEQSFSPNLRETYPIQRVR